MTASVVGFEIERLPEQASMRSAAIRSAIGESGAAQSASPSVASRFRTYPVRGNGAATCSAHSQISASGAPSRSRNGRSVQKGGRVARIDERRRRHREDSSEDLRLLGLELRRTQPLEDLFVNSREGRWRLLRRVAVVGGGAHGRSAAAPATMVAPLAANTPERGAASVASGVGFSVGSARRWSRRTVSQSRAFFARCRTRPASGVDLLRLAGESVGRQQIQRGVEPFVERVVARVALLPRLQERDGLVELASAARRCRISAIVEVVDRRILAGGEGPAAPFLAGGLLELIGATHQAQGLFEDAERPDPGRDRRVIRGGQFQGTTAQVLGRLEVSRGEEDLARVLGADPAAIVSGSFRRSGEPKPREVKSQCRVVGGEMDVRRVLAEAGDAAELACPPAHLDPSAMH